MAGGFGKLPLGSNENGLLRSRWLPRVSLQLVGLLLAVLGWLLAILSATSGQWEIWDAASFEDIGCERMQLGPWSGCSRGEETNVKSSKWHNYPYMLQHSSVPTEMSMVQGLMTLACILISLAVILMVFALGSLSIDEKDRQQSFNSRVFLNLSGVIYILMSTSWYIYSILEKELSAFSEDFDLPQIPNNQQVGFATYIGYAAAACQLLSILVNLCNQFRIPKKPRPLLCVTVDPPPFHFPRVSECSFYINFP